MRLLSLSRTEQSNATRDRGVRSSSGFGSIERNYRHAKPHTRDVAAAACLGLRGRWRATQWLMRAICNLPCRNRVTLPNLHGAFWMMLVMPMIEVCGLRHR
jgi:hypothetical protein